MRRRRVKRPRNAGLKAVSLGDTPTQRLTSAVIGLLVKRKQGVFKELKLGWDAGRADVVSLSLRCIITIVEVKTSIGDARSDVRKGKWKTYLPYCHKFYWAFPLSLWQKHKEELASYIELGAGVIVLGATGHARVVRRCVMRSVEGVKLKETVTRLAWRGSEYSARTHFRTRIDPQ